jgi:hypothetical protein
MIVLETQPCWETPILEERLRQDEEARRKRLGRLHPIQDALLYFVKEHDGEEVRNATLGHRYARMRGYRNRHGRDELIKEAWRHLTPLLRIGYLEWGNRRNHVRLAPPEKHQQFLARIEQNIASFPKPRLPFGA